MNKIKKTHFEQGDLAGFARKHEADGTPSQQFDIHIDKHGQWHHQGVVIKRQSLVRLLSGLLVRLEDGGYWLVSPAERGQITVEDAPFFISEAKINGKGHKQNIMLKTTCDDDVFVNERNPIFFNNHNDGQSRPYITIRGQLNAVISRPVYYELAEYAVEYQGRIGLWSEGDFIQLAE